MKKYWLALLVSIFIFQVGYYGYPYFRPVYYQSSRNIYIEDHGFEKAISQLLEQESKGVTFYVYQHITIVYNEEYGSSINCLISKNKDIKKIYQYRYYRGHWHEEGVLAQYDVDKRINGQEFAKLSAFKDISLEKEYHHAIQRKKPKERVQGLVTVIQVNTKEITTFVKPE